MARLFFVFDVYYCRVIFGGDFYFSRSFRISTCVLFRAIVFYLPDVLVFRRCKKYVKDWTEETTVGSCGEALNRWRVCR